MRQGNVFDMWINRFHEICDNRKGNDKLFLRVPWEVSEHWDKFRSVTWVDNRDGTYTLTPFN